MSDRDIVTIKYEERMPGAGDFHGSLLRLVLRRGTEQRRDVVIGVRFELTELDSLPSDRLVETALHLWLCGGVFRITAVQPTRHAPRLNSALPTRSATRTTSGEPSGRERLPPFDPSANPFAAETAHRTSL
jgi:hypothetical protein